MLRTIAIGTSGDVVPVNISMDPSWGVTAIQSDGAVSHLSLSCLFPWGENAIYLFGSLDRTGSPVDSLPSPVSEVLIFPPMVPLKHQLGGFQALSPEEWDALVATQLSDRPPTCASAPLQSFKRRMVTTRSSVDEEVQSLLAESDDESSDGAESAPLAAVPVDDEDEDLQSEPESYGSAASF